MENIIELKEKLFRYLEENGFEKKLNSRMPFKFLYIKTGSIFNLEFIFPDDYYNPAPIEIELLYKSDLKSQIAVSYDIYKKTGCDFLKVVKESLIKQIEEYLLNKLNEDI